MQSPSHNRLFEHCEPLFAELSAGLDFATLRLQRNVHETLSVQRGVVQPPRRRVQCGVMLTVVDQGGIGYAATADLSATGLQQALQQARHWADLSARHGLFDAQALPRPAQQGEYHSTVQQDWHATPLRDKLELLRAAADALHCDARIVDWQAELNYLTQESLLLTSTGGRIYQHIAALEPRLSATAQADGDAQTRSSGGDVQIAQGGLEILHWRHFHERPRQIAEQALELLAAPNCPDATLDLVLAPDQMVLQLHESVGHPLELDRILGDERNYAGTSFVTPEMFGHYQYGSTLLNVSFDPTRNGQIASYAFDDDGTPAHKEYLIKNGLLLRPLGGVLSQQRAALAGVANSRSCAWNRPTIDRMANLNLEQGESSFEDLLGQIEHGVYMETNRSWSIDDSRNKFQFGCEWGRLIEQGQLTTVVKNPNYRGVSANFWRSLAAVGNTDTLQVLGVANCGKGEPNQAITVGHATPPCLFRKVAVFGGE
ncbi:MAG: TldD/PmbA family protein [Candidatus Competibacteraceae bacterium]|nr:TldD/PmbA family protein [Candidatus Competibacteraceae bacterium]MCB1812495.1 TldD/PmbA family protein [Candidatus Competibacteraceae bacterium]